MNRGIRALVLAGCVVTAVTALPSGAGANSAVRHAEITSVETFGPGFTAVYHGVAAQITQTGNGVVVGECAFLRIGGLLPEDTTATCWFEDAETRSRIPAVEGLVAPGGGVAAALNVIGTASDRQLRYCIRVEATILPITWLGPNRCALL